MPDHRESISQVTQRSGHDVGPGLGAVLFIHAHTALHPGSGTAIGAVDLPVQRERHTGWPLIQGSTLKGVLRDACRARIAGEIEKNSLQEAAAAREHEGGGQGARESRPGNGRSVYDLADRNPDLVVAFGPPTQSASDHAGALSFTDGRILAFPVRSLKGLFGWVTSAGVWERWVRDAGLAGISVTDVATGSLTESEALVVPDSPLLLSEGTVVLEEFEFRARPSEQLQQLASWLADKAIHQSFAPLANRLRKGLVLLPEDWFTHFVQHATEISARIRLDYETKTVEKGALFYTEYLPPETLMYSVVLSRDSYRFENGRPTHSAREVLQFVRSAVERPEGPSVLQIGADETSGKGLCVVRFAP